MTTGGIRLLYLTAGNAGVWIEGGVKFQGAETLSETVIVAQLVKKYPTCLDYETSSSCS
jgi:hypothetical protein